MKQQASIVQKPVWETRLFGLLWICLIARGCYAVFEASTGMQLCSILILIWLSFE